MTPHEIWTDLPAVTGCPALTQGRYGSVGNLELVAPGADGGLWVFWFNADTVETYEGVAVGHWSAGMRFGGSAPTTRATVTQMTSGPDFIEVLSSDTRAVYRHCWSPSSGFVAYPALGPGAEMSALIEHDGHACTVVVQDGRASLARASLSTYPDLAWDRTDLEMRLRSPGLAEVDGALLVTGLDEHDRLHRFHPGDGESAILPGRWSSAELLSDASIVGLDTQGRIAYVHSEQVSVLWPDQSWDAITAAVTTLGSGRIDIVARRGRQLWHGHTDGAAPSLIRSRQWR